MRGGREEGWRGVVVGVGVVEALWPEAGSGECSVVLRPVSLSSGVSQQLQQDRGRQLHHTFLWQMYVSREPWGDLL